MARPWTAKAGRHVTYHTASGKAQSATVVGTSSNGGIILRVGHTTAKGDATTGVVRHTSGGRSNNFRVA